ncbi:hypothetical protein WJX72_010722 [[Myrmecia] bisecta]|uniref:Uncharacterized protein n=1 Tax=[Myrmecia] bisecta TaxID=41462 RepID=A0AAW1QB72_9CHLO
MLFAASTLYCVPFFLLMLLLPYWRPTRRIVRHDATFAPLALAYLFLLAHSWQPDTWSLILPGSFAEGFTGGFKVQFLPTLEGIMLLFSRLTTAASLWVHLLAINLFAARTAFLQGLEHGIPFRHSVVLCAAFGPLGMVSHLLTRAFWRKRRDQGVAMSSRDGTLIIMPYGQET